jgi:hypothetical protein
MHEHNYGASPPGAPSPARSLVPIAIGVVAFLAVAAGGYLLVNRTSSTPERATTRDSSNEAAPRAIGAVTLDPDDIVDVIPQDGIPAIDEPRFESVAEVNWLADQEPVIALEFNGDARAYPLQIMTWHEIVNDEVGGTPVAVTFCPLCNTAIAFERPEIGGKVTTFGTSGKLINSNLLMYDRATESLWPQVTGQALVGELKGTKLRRIPARIVSWDEFKTAFPSGEVLSRDTGHDRSYGENPYPGYDDVDSSPFLFSGEADGRLAAVERVLGLEADGEIVAFPYFQLKKEASGGLAAANEKIGSRPVVVFWKAGTVSALDRPEISASRDVGAAVAYSRRIGGMELTFVSQAGAIVDQQTHTTWNLLGRATDGRLQGRSLKPVNAVDSFWFDWAAFHPETKIWAGS